MQDLTLNLSVDQTNLILEALGNMPFSRVYQTIQTIQEQAAKQMNGQTHELVETEPKGAK